MDVRPETRPSGDPPGRSLEPDGDTALRWLHAVADRAFGVVAQRGDRPVLPADRAAQDAATDDMLLPPDARPGDLGELLTRLDQAASCAADMGDPGFLGYTPTSGILASALGEMYAQLVNRYVTLSEAAPAMAAMEHGLIRWLAGVVGLPADSGGLLLSGGSLANFTAVATAARYAEDNGRAGTVHVSRQAHHSLHKAIRSAGIPADRVREIPTDDQLRLDVEALNWTIGSDRRAGLAPALIIGTAGTTATGAVDPLPDVAATARRVGAWFHVDAAYGGLFRLTERGRAATAGIEAADSVTVDPHKSLFLPCGTGALIVRDARRLRAAHTAQCDALLDVRERDGLPDISDLGLELTREARGPRLWLPLHLHGVAAFRDALDEKLDLARAAYRRLADSPVLEAPWPPELAVVAFRLPARHHGGDTARANAANERLLDEINASGRTLVSSVPIDGVLTLRMSILSHHTHAAHVDAALDLIEARARALSPREVTA